VLGSLGGPSDTLKGMIGESTKVGHKTQADDLSRLESDLEDTTPVLEGSMFESGGQKPDQTKMFSLLNENKVMTIIEKALLEKYQDKLDPNVSVTMGGDLLRHVERIENYVVAHLKMKDVPISNDPTDWTRNKLRVDWAEKVTHAWLHQGEEGIYALKERVPAVISLAWRNAARFQGYSPYKNHTSQEVMVRSALESLSLDVVQKISDIPNAQKSSEIIKTVCLDMQNIALRQVEGVEGRIDGVTSEDKGFLFANMLNRVKAVYMLSFDKALAAMPLNNVMLNHVAKEADSHLSQSKLLADELATTPEMQKTMGFSSSPGR